MSQSFDVAVVGAGAAGVAAAVGAARAGATTVVIDKHRGAGGTGGFSGLTTLCGLYTAARTFLNEGLSREFAEALMRRDGISAPTKMGRLWVQLYRPASLRSLADELLAAEDRLTSQWGTDVRDITVRGERVQRVNGRPIGAVIDCTGVAAVGRLCGDPLLHTDETTQASAVLVHLTGVENELSTVGAARIIVGAAHAGLPSLSFMPSLAPSSVVIKFTGTPDQVPGLLTYLRGEVAGFAKCSAQELLPLARRAGSMIVGRYILTGADVLEGRKFPDAVARGCWPVEQWSASGEQRMRYLHDDTDYYEIPARSLRAKRTKNLFMAGKSLSADADAVASVRVIGCCLATGAAAGELAAHLL